MTGSESSGSSSPLRASQLLRGRSFWLPSAIVVSVLVFVLTLIYFGAFVNPAGHLHGLPVALVDEDAGATVGSQRVDFGEQVARGFTGSPAVSQRLALRSTSLKEAQRRMNLGQEYATVVIPAGFSASLLGLAGVSVPAASASKPTVTVLTNQRAGSLGVSLATGVLNPALAKASNQIGKRLLSLPTSGRENATVRAVAADPITVAAVAFRPLSSHTAVGLSPFYIALLSILFGFMGATIINTSVDSALGYGATEIGPFWRMRQPVAITRWQTLLAKWGIAVFVTLVLTGMILAAAVGVLGLEAPHFGELWLLMWFASAVAAIGTLTLLATLGSVGALVAILVFVYLSLASSGGTVPLQALGGFFRFVANFEPLRQVLGGTRSILYFNAQGAAGLTRAWIATALGLVFWLALGALVTNWYDRRGLDRLSPELMEYVDRAVRDRHETQEPASRGDSTPER